MTLIDLFYVCDKHHPIRVLDSKSKQILRYGYDPEKDVKLGKRDLSGCDVKIVYSVMDVTQCPNNGSYARSQLIAEIVP